MTTRSKRTGLTRRGFLKGTAAMAGACAVPAFRIGAAEKPGGKLNVACVGVGGRGGAHLSGCQAENIMALCDVDSNNIAKVTKKMPGVKTFADFRVMLDKMGKDIDAVTIATPDHTHYPIAMACMQRGKHVVVEKPLTQTVWEARTLRKAAHRYNVVHQMGNQGHATDHIRVAKEWFEAGVLGEVKEVHAWNGGPSEHYFGNPQSYPPPESPVPPSLDWDLWLGPRAERPHSTAYVPRTWRGWWDFGSGPLGDWGCHTADLPFWCLNLDGPVSVEAQVGGVRFPQYIPAWAIVTWEFPARGALPPVTVTWYDGGKLPKPPVGVEKIKGSGMYMVGSKATLMTGGRPNFDLCLTEPEKFEDLKRNQPPRTIPRVKGGHWEEWIQAIKGTGPKPGSNFDYAVPLSQMLLLGGVAERLPGKKLLWDNEAGTFTNSPEANALLRSTPRKGWEFDVA